MDNHTLGFWASFFANLVADLVALIALLAVAIIFGGAASAWAAMMAAAMYALHQLFEHKCAGATYRLVEHEDVEAAEQHKRWGDMSIACRVSCWGLFAVASLSLLVHIITAWI